MTDSRPSLARFAVASVISLIALVAILGLAHLLAPLLDTTVEFTAAALLSGAFVSQTLRRVLPVL